MRTDNPWQIVTSKTVYENRWIKIVEDSVITPSGSNGIYTYMKSKDSVIITVLNNSNELYLIRAFSYPDKSWNWELPGGGSDGEDVARASKRELEEETGIKANTWKKLGSTRVCNGLMTERMTTYLATDISFDGEREVADEQISEARFFAMQEVDAMIERGEINDGQSITAIHLVQKWLQRQEKEENV